MGMEVLRRYECVDPDTKELRGHVEIGVDWAVHICGDDCEGQTHDIQLTSEFFPLRSGYTYEGTPL